MHKIKSNGKAEEAADAVVAPLVRRCTVTLHRCIPNPVARLAQPSCTLLQRLNHSPKLIELKRTIPICIKLFQQCSGLLHPHRFGKDRA